MTPAAAAANPYQPQNGSSVSPAATAMAGSNPAYAPAFRLFLENAKLADQLDAADLQDLESSTFSNVALGQQDIARQGERQRENIGYSYEGRGLAGSGMEGTAMSRQREAEGQALGALKGDAGARLAAARRQAARSQIDRGGRIATQLINSAQQLTNYTGGSGG